MIYINKIYLINIMLNKMIKFMNKDSNKHISNLNLH